MTTTFVFLAFIAGGFSGAVILWLTQRAIAKERFKAQKSQMDALTSLRGEIEERLKILTGDALKSNHILSRISSSTVPRKPKVSPVGK